MTYLDDEVDRIKEDRSGQYSHEDVQAAESWRLTWERRWESQVTALASQREQAKKEKQVRLYELIRASQKAADENLRALDAGEMSVPEYLNRSARIKEQADEYERRLQGLDSAESLIDEMRGDPVGWQDSFFDKWTSLQRMRPNLNVWIHESRMTRRNRTRERGSNK